MDDNNLNKSPKNKIILTTLTVALVVGIVFGGITGAITGVLSTNYLLPWFEDTFNLTLPQLIEDEGPDRIQVVEESATVDVVEQASPAVVSIVITKELSTYYSSAPGLPFDFFGFEWPFLQPEEEEDAPTVKQEIGGGTGFIISEDGLILTNKHVMADEDAEYTVVLNDGTQYGAEMVGQDPFLDLAIVKIEASDLPILELGDSDSIQIGQTVIAIGNALSEYRNTVTKGVVSGINRRIEAGDSSGGSEVIEEAIQTDAAINPGNSGGPLLNLAGQVIGVNTAVSQQGQSVGFAIPINPAKKIVESIKEYGRIVRPWLGVRYMIINDAIAKENNLSVDYGALIVRGRNPGDLAIIPASPADKAGLLENDIILEIEGEQIDEEHPLAMLIAQHDPGETIKLKVLSKGEEKTVLVTLEEYEESTSED
jgi:serine protease Do